MIIVPQYVIVIVVNKMSLKEIRESFGISQAAAASTIGMPLRTYVRYESDENYGSELKRQSIVATLNDAYKITETKGLYTIEQINGDKR